MSERSSPPRPSAFEQILDLLLDALLERQAARRAQSMPGALPDEPPSASPLATPLEPAPIGQPALSERGETTAAQPDNATPAPAIRELDVEAQLIVQNEPAGEFAPVQEPGSWEDDDTEAQPLASIKLDRTLRRLLIALIVTVVLVNIPLNAAGVSLSRALPDARSLIIRDGLVLKGSGPEIYVLESNKLRWISSLEAFEFFGHRWEQVNIVEDDFLSSFEKGRPIHVLLKCTSSPHIYALENGQKRWIKDIPTFEAEGYVWEDVKFVSCGYLRGLPDGPPIPPDAGPPPQP